MLQLDIFRDCQHLETLEFDQEVVKIGRLKSSHVRLDDPHVKRMHAVLETEGDGVRIINLGGKTFLNTQKVDLNAEVNEGDILDVGPFKVRVSKLSSEGLPSPKITGNLVVEDPFENRVFPEESSPVLSKGSLNHVRYVPPFSITSGGSGTYCKKCGVKFDSSLPSFCMGRFRELSFWRKVWVLFFQ